MICFQHGLLLKEILVKEHAFLFTVILSISCVILGIILDEVWHYTKKKYAEKNPLDIEWHFIKVPARLATPDELDSFDYPHGMSPFDYLTTQKGGVWCGEVHLRMKIRNKSKSTLEINNFDFLVEDSEQCNGATVYFVPGGANESLGFIVNLDEEHPIAYRCYIENHMPCGSSMTDWFGSGSTISVVPQDTCNAELIARVEKRCRTFTMNIKYSIAGKPKQLENVFRKPVTVTPFDRDIFKQSLFYISGRRLFVEEGTLSDL